ncbi:zinc-dependent alcohol dehydrogenase [Alicyclobacillus sp.]|uniref:zinc-dependent alcohol dehydrogenase n=1 Tax=Alicyclobacillus sp. TaxID=61169 RepID=UPI0025BD39A7|nr:zinc-dependent alcohol dehydrogenase [Alicyclobacillus sp.]MCL6517459.1 glutathione-dependent formaldehyde dehydrogenase [Alicyclobacillus sp.]
MRAVTYQGYKRVEVREVPDPALERPDDMIVRITRTAICGSDLHLVHGMIPNFPEGYIIGHEPMGVVEEVGREVTKVKPGDRVVIPFNVACGSCWYCQNQLESQCDASNPNEDCGGYFGYSHTFGGYPGAQAEYLRVPFANFTSFRVPEDCEVEDDALLLLADAMPTAYWSVDNAGVKPGDTVVVLGCGPVGLLTQKFAWLKGAERVIAVDYLEDRLDHALRTNHVETVKFDERRDTGAYLHEMTKGGADVVIDCVGMDGKMTTLERVETALKLQGGTLGAIEMAAQAVRKGGTIQITGAYGLRYNLFPLGHLFNRNITVRMGQAPVIHYMPYLYNLMADGKIDPTDIITHHLPLSEAPRGYDLFDGKEDGCIKVVMQP